MTDATVSIGTEEGNIMIGTDIKPIEYEVPELKPNLGSVNWSQG